MGQRKTGCGHEANAKTLKHFWLTMRHFVELHPTLIAKKKRMFGWQTSQHRLT